MRKSNLTVCIMMLLVGCGGTTVSSPAAEPAPDTSSTSTAIDPKSESTKPGGDPGTNLPSKDWQAASGTVDVRLAELEGWNTTNNIDPKKDGDKILAMKFAVGDKSSAPDWVSKGSWHDEANSVMFGVGTISGLKNQALAVMSAENRARAEISKLIEITIEQKESAGRKTIKTMTAMTITGVVIVDWYADDKGAVFALAAMPRMSE